MRGGFPFSPLRSECILFFSKGLMNKYTFAVVIMTPLVAAQDVPVL